MNQRVRNTAVKQTEFAQTMVPQTKLANIRLAHTKLAQSKLAQTNLTKCLLSLCTLLIVVALMVPTAYLATNQAWAEDDNLSQVIDPNQQQGKGHVVITQGHLDFGPTLSTGSWKLQIHDDSGEVSYWRNPADTVMHVTDDAILPMPDGDKYSFVGETPGTDLWVIPQTQNPDVVWLGWNTQEPQVMQHLQRGMKLSLEDVQGPGELDVYLENGNLGAPEVLWTSKAAYPQDTWIEVNAHTHVNWIFHKTGVYQVKLTVSGTLDDGSEVSDTDTLQFAVGSDTDPQTAFVSGDAVSDAGVSDEAATNDEADAQADEDESSQSAAASGVDPVQANRERVLLISVIVGLAALVVLMVVALVWAKSKASRQQALDEITLRS